MAVISSSAVAGFVAKGTSCTSHNRKSIKTSGS